MNSFFDYGLNDVGQIAFLRWLILQYDCEDEQVSFYARKLLSSFMGLETIIEREDLSKITAEYWNEIDDVAFMFGNKGVPSKIFIAYEISSYQNKKLKEYNKYIEENCKKGTTYYRVFLKNSSLRKKEYERIIKAGWTVFDLKKHAQLFSDIKVSDVKNEILGQFIHTITRLNAIQDILNKYQKDILVC